MSRDQKDKNILYCGLVQKEHEGFLKFEYYSFERNSWQESRRSFFAKGRDCAAKVVRDVSQLVANSNKQITSVGILDGLEESRYFNEALMRCYNYYVSHKSN